MFKTIIPSPDKCKTLSSVLEQEIENLIKQTDLNDETINAFNATVTKLYTLDKIVFSDELSGENKPPCPWTRIICVIDTSGSTANFDGGRSRSRSSRFQTSTDETETDLPQTVTKPIILAEIECTIQTLRVLISTFNMSGVQLIVQPFSSSFCVFEYIVESNKDLCNMINENFDKLPYECGGTELVTPLKYLAKEYFTGDAENLVILATDGQPSDKDNVYEILKQYRTMFNLIVIGAGSIGSNACNDFCFRGRNIADIKPDTLQTLVDIGAMSHVTFEIIQNIGDKKRQSNAQNAQNSSSYSECDITYLKKLVNDENVTTGLYVGAYGDYTDAVADVDNFLKLVCDSKVNSDKKFGIILDNMLFIKYDEFIHTTLLSGHYVIMRTRNNAFYLVTPMWQMAIDNPFGNSTIDTCVISDVESSIPNLMKMNYDDIYELKPTNITNVITLVKPNQDTLKTTISVDNKGFAKVRKVHYS